MYFYIYTYLYIPILPIGVPYQHPLTLRSYRSSTAWRYTSQPCVAFGAISCSSHVCSTAIEIGSWQTAAIVIQ